MATAALPARPESRSITRRVVVVAGVVLLIFFAFIEIVPFVLTVTNSFKCLPAVQANPQAFVPVPPFGVSCRTDSGAARSASEVSTPLTFNPALEGYNEIFGQNLGQWFVNTVVFSVAVTLARLLFDSLAGYALARIKFPGNRVFFFVMLGTMMIPGVVLLIPRFIILKQLGMLNTYQGFIFSLAADAFGVFLMKQFFESIPEEIEEAAQVDGASRFVMFFRVVLPMATPALTALTIFSFQGTWNNFMDALIILGGNQNLYNLPLGLALLRGAYGETLRWHTFLAGSVITTLPLALVFFAFQRYFVEGISYSGLKG
ncbi:MAG: carbohydrate ABC transporter permease [Anaerolineae bacterium]